MNRPFYRHGGYIEFVRLKEYYGIPRGALAECLRRLFEQKENFTVYFSGKRRSLLYANTAQRSIFSDHNLFLGKLKAKLSRKGHVNTERVYRIMLPRHPIILLKSNKFKMAAVSVKRSIPACPLGKQFSHFALPGPLLARLS